MKLVKLVAVLILAALSCSAETPEDHERTLGLFNGRYWKSLTDEQRVFLVLGYAEHASVSEGEGCRERDGLRFPSKANFGETAKGLTRIFDDPENALIPIAFALNAYQMRLSGVAETVVFETLTAYRKIAAAPAETK